MKQKTNITSLPTRDSKKEKDDTLFEDYVEVREMVTGEGSVHTITHGEFLDVLANLIEQREK